MSPASRNRRPWLVELDDATYWRLTTMAAKSGRTVAQVVARLVDDVTRAPAGTYPTEAEVAEIEALLRPMHEQDRDTPPA